MATIASLGIALTANSTQLQTGLTQAERRTRQYARRSEASLRRVRGAFRGLRGALVGVIAGFAGRQLLQGVDQLVKLSSAAGVGFEAFQRLQFALEQTGVNSTQTASALVRSSRAIDELRTSTGTAGEALSRLGFDIAALEGLSPQETFLTISEALSAVGDQALQASLASDIFGNRLAVALLPSLSSTGDSLRELGDSITPITELDGRNIEEFNDTVNRLSVTFRNLVTTFSPVLNSFGSFLNSVIDIARAIPGLSTLIGAAGLAGVLAFVTTRVISFSASIASTLSGFIGLAAAAGPGTNAISRLGYQMAVNGSLIDATNGRLSRFVMRLGLLPGVGRLATVAVNGISFALRGMGAALRFAFGPVGLVIIAVESLVYVFQTGLTRSLKQVANLFIRLANGVIRAANSIRRFTGGNAIEYFELYDTSVAKVVESTTELEESLYDAAGGAIVLEDAVEPLSDRLQTLLDTLYPARAEFTTFLSNMDLLQEAFDDNLLTLDQYNEAVAELAASILPEASEQVNVFADTLTDAMDITEEIQQVGVNAFDGIADSLTNLVVNGKASFRDLARSILQDLIRIQIRKALAFSLGGGGGSLAGIFGRQGGGPVSAGQVYQVGEAGPELFVPQSNGTIVPNERVGGGGSVTLNINAVDARSFQQLAASDPSFIYNLAERGRRTLGV